MKSANQAISDIMSLIKKLPRNHQSKHKLYSKSIKEAVSKAVAQGISASEIARFTGIANSTIYKWSKSQSTGMSHNSMRLI